MTDGKMMREMRGTLGGSRKAALGPLKTKTLIVTERTTPIAFADLINLDQVHQLTEDKDGGMSTSRGNLLISFLMTEISGPPPHRPENWGNAAQDSLKCFPLYFFFILA